MRDTMRGAPAARRGMHPATGAVPSAFDDFGEKEESERDLTSDRATSRDVEIRPQVTKKKQPGAHDDDPFGNEENSEVKYRTLRWWCVH